MSTITLVALSITINQTIFNLLINLEWNGLLYKICIILICYTGYKISTYHKEETLSNSQFAEVIHRPFINSSMFHILAIAFSCFVGLYFYFFEKGDGWETIIAPLMAFFCYFFLNLLVLVFVFLRQRFGVSSKSYIIVLVTLCLLILAYIFVVEVVLIEWLGINPYNYL